VKTDRFSKGFLRKVGVFAAGFLLAADLSNAGGTVTIGPFTIGINSSSKKLADALASQVQEVQTKLAERRRTLPIVQSSDGKPAFLRQDVASLIAHTGEDLDKAIVNVQPSELEPLRAWSADELRRIQAELTALPGPKAAAFSSGPSTPYAVAVVASLSSPPKHAAPKAAAPKAVAPQPAPPPPPDTVPAEKSNGLLDKVGEVVSQIFTLASHNDLEVKLWVGSTAPHTDFSFWSAGQIKKDVKANHTVRTNGKLEVIRGLYYYHAASGQGAVTDIIEYSTSAATQATAGERLDTVKGSRFFCCRFDQHYCHHVADEKECRL